MTNLDERRLAVAERHPAFAARVLLEETEEALVASIISKLFEQMPRATCKVLLELAAIIKSERKS
jgi:hypothetical protein